MFWTRVGCFQHGGQDPEVTYAGTKTSKVPTRVNLLPYIYSVPLSSSPRGVFANLRVTFKLLLLNSDRTTVMGGFFLPSTNIFFNFGLGLFYNEVLLDNVM